MKKFIFSLLCLAIPMLSGMENAVAVKTAKSLAESFKLDHYVQAPGQSETTQSLYSKFEAAKPEETVAFSFEELLVLRSMIEALAKQ